MQKKNSKFKDKTNPFNIQEIGKPENRLQNRESNMFASFILNVPFLMANVNFEKLLFSFLSQYNTMITFCFIPRSSR